MCNGPLLLQGSLSVSVPGRTEHRHWGGGRDAAVLERVPRGQAPLRAAAGQGQHPIEEILSLVYKCGI
jgi:hypothetical protein